MTPNNQSRANAEIRDLIENWAESVRNLDIIGAVVDHAEDMLHSFPSTLEGQAGA